MPDPPGFGIVDHRLCEAAVSRVCALPSGTLVPLLLAVATLPLCAQSPPGAPQDVGAPGPVDALRAPRPSLRAQRTRDEIRINGIVNEPAWFTADSATDFFQNLPDPGMPATERTVVRVLYDDRFLYVGAVMYDGGRLITPGLEQDFATNNSDLFALAIDSYHDGQSAFVFAVNPGGAITDMQTFNDSRTLVMSWEGVVEQRTELLDNGWSAEFKIPFTTLRFDARPGEQTWGINFQRRIRRNSEDAYWAPLPRQFRIHKMSMAGELQGLSGLQPGRNLTVKPYVSASRSDGTVLTADASGNDLDAGVDVKWSVTPRLTLDATLLTDFSQVEADQEQVNLTRFDLFFPEKRDFFLENEGVFTVGDLTERNFRTGSSTREFTIFHSRRIGLSQDRRPIPIAGGARLSGRMGQFEVGVLNMQTQASTLGPAENFAVARLRRQIGSSDIGVLFTSRQGTSDGATGTWNRTGAIDLNLRPHRNMIVTSYAALSAEPGVGGDRSAARVQVGWRDPVWDVSGFAKHVGAEFNPGIGFVRRRDVNQVFATVGAHPQIGIPQVLEVNPRIDVSVIANNDWTVETRELEGGFAVAFADGGNLQLQYTNQFERLLEPDAIAGVQIAEGEYTFNRGTIVYRSSGARWLSGSLEVSHGGFYDGGRTSISASTSIRPDYHVSLELKAQYNDLSLGGQDFTADIYSGKLRVALSTQLFASAFVQYNSSSGEAITNVRLNLIHAPLSDVFLVFQERRSTDQNEVLDRVITAKITRLLAF